MLQELRINNFLSWLNLTWNPKDINLLIGLNNSGKTNLCKALRFLSLTASQPLDKCAEWVLISKHALTNFAFEGNQIEFFIRAEVPLGSENAAYEYSLRLIAPSSESPLVPLRAVEEKLVVSSGGSDQVTLLESDGTDARLLNEEDYLNGRQTYVPVSAPPDTTMLSRLYESKTALRANHFRQYLHFWQYYEVSQQALRGIGYTPNNFVLSPDGSNLSSVIYSLRKTNERSYRRLLECLRRLEPTLEFVNFSGGDAEPSVFMYFDFGAGKSLPAWTASSGTLRFMALVYILLVQPMLTYRPLIVIEEPENGVFVGRLKEILEMATEGATTPQLIFTTHSPYFIDLFDARLDSVFTCKREEFHSTLLGLDVAQAKRRLEEYPLGEQHFRQLLG